MEKDNNNSIVYSTNVVAFVAVASEFCRMTESVSQYDTAALIDLSRKLLSLLYFKASLLPQVDPVLDEELEKYVTELDYNRLLQKWNDRLGEYDGYYEVFDPEIQFGNETVTASISEGLLDIYQDLKDFITAYSLGNEEVMNDALAECIAHFRDFWGQRLVNVLRALHQLSFAGIEWEHDSAKRDKTVPDKDESNWVDRFFDQNNG